MAYTGKALELAMPYLKAMSTGQHFDTSGTDEDPELSMQAETQEKVASLRRGFPGAIWRKEYLESLEWWQYTTRLDNGLTVRIYAVTEAPATCRAVMKTVAVEELVPTEYETRLVTKEVIDHWDCGDDGDNA